MSIPKRHTPHWDHGRRGSVEPAFDLTPTTVKAPPPPQTYQRGGRKRDWFRANKGRFYQTLVVHDLATTKRRDDIFKKSMTTKDLVDYSRTHKYVLGQPSMMKMTKQEYDLLHQAMDCRVNDIEEKLMLSHTKVQEQFIQRGVYSDEVNAFRAQLKLDKALSLTTKVGDVRAFAEEKLQQDMYESSPERQKQLRDEQIRREFDLKVKNAQEGVSSKKNSRQLSKVLFNFPTTNLSGGQSRRSTLPTSDDDGEAGTDIYNRLSRKVRAKARIRELEDELGVDEFLSENAEGMTKEEHVTRFHRKIKERRLARASELIRPALLHQQQAKNYSLGKRRKRLVSQQKVIPVMTAAFYEGASQEITDENSAASLSVDPNTSALQVDSLAWSPSGASAQHEDSAGVFVTPRTAVVQGHQVSATPAVRGMGAQQTGFVREPRAQHMGSRGKDGESAGGSPTARVSNSRGRARATQSTRPAAAPTRQRLHHQHAESTQDMLKNVNKPKSLFRSATTGILDNLNRRADVHYDGGGDGSLTETSGSASSSEEEDYSLAVRRKVQLAGMMKKKLRRRTRGFVKSDNPYSVNMHTAHIFNCGSAEPNSVSTFMRAIDEHSKSVTDIVNFDALVRRREKQKRFAKAVKKVQLMGRFSKNKPLWMQAKHDHIRKQKEAQDEKKRLFETQKAAMSETETLKRYGNVVMKAAQHKHRFMVVEATRDACDTIAGKLGRLGYHYVTRTDAKSFFRQLRNQPHKHDVIMLPSNITGIEVLYTIQNSHLCDIPCVVYAYERANLNSLDLAKWIRLGAAAVFFEAEFDEEHKPFLVKRIWDLAGLPIAERLTQSAKNVLKKITWDKEQAEKRKKKNLHPMRLLDAAKKVQEQHGITNHGVGVHKRSVHDRTIRMWNNCHYSDESRALMLVTYASEDTITMFTAVLIYCETLADLVIARYAMLNQYPSLSKLYKMIQKQRGKFIREERDRATTAAKQAEIQAKKARDVVDQRRKEIEAANKDKRNSREANRSDSARGPASARRRTTPNSAQPSQSHAQGGLLNAVSSKLAPVSMPSALPRRHSKDGFPGDPKRAITEAEHERLARLAVTKGRRMSVSIGESLLPKTHGFEIDEVKRSARRKSVTHLQAMKWMSKTKEQRAESVNLVPFVPDRVKDNFFQLDREIMKLVIELHSKYAWDFIWNGEKYEELVNPMDRVQKSAEELAAISKKNKDDAHKLQKRLSELDNPGGVTNYVTFQQSIIIEETWKQVHKERKQAGIGAQVPSAISKDTEDFFDSYDMAPKESKDDNENLRSVANAPEFAAAAGVSLPSIQLDSITN